MTSRLGALVGWLGLTSLACGASTMIGDAPPDVWSSTVGAGGGGECTPPLDPGDHAFTAPTGLLGTWTGYFQGTTLAVGDDAITLTIEAGSGGGSDQVHIALGSKPAPPAATDPTAIYPPGAGPYDYGVGASQPIQGFRYPAHEVQWLGQRLKFQLAVGEAWDSWCKLQKSYEIHNPTVRYSCVPGVGFLVEESDAGGMVCSAYVDGRTMATVPLPCDQMNLCNYGVCDCDQCGCAGSVASTGGFDVTFDGDVATGTGPAGFTTGYLRLTRAAN